MAATYRISEASALSGVSSANIRFYEKEKLLCASGRYDNSYRFYSESDIHQLRFIRLCRAMDMSLGEVRSLLGLDLNIKADCHAARLALDEHLGHVRGRLAELKTLEAKLESLRQRCDGTGSQCHIIEALHQQANRLPVLAPAAATSKRHV